MGDGGRWAWKWNIATQFDNFEVDVGTGPEEIQEEALRLPGPLSTDGRDRISSRGDPAAMTSGQVLNEAGVRLPVPLTLLSAGCRRL